MKRAVLTIGIPASGKSTYAQNLGIQEINLDNCREAVSGDPTNQACTPQAVQLHTQLVDAAIAAEADFVVSDTNIQQNFRASLVFKLKAAGYQVVFAVFQTPLAECLRRNAAREKPVPEAAMLRLHGQFVDQSDWEQEADEVVYFGQPAQEKILVGHYATLRGKYEIRVFKHANGKFSYATFTSGKSDGSGYGYDDPAEVAGYVARMIHGAARVDKIRYRAVLPMAEVSAISAALAAR